MYLQKKPKVLPMMFIITADIAGGNATIDDVKWAVAKTTPKEEFCMPTCKKVMRKEKLFTRIVILKCGHLYFSDILT